MNLKKYINLKKYANNLAFAFKKLKKEKSLSDLFSLARHDPRHNMCVGLGLNNKKKNRHGTTLHT